LIPIPFSRNQIINPNKEGIFSLPQKQTMQNEELDNLGMKMFFKILGETSN
jgi:hypothetical protein